MKGLQGKVAVVTGGSSGIGQAIAIRLGEEGVDVAINYVGRPEGAEETKETIEHGVDICMKQMAACRNAPDPRRSRRVQGGRGRRHVRPVLAEYGRVDYLINNAGIQIAEDTDKLAVADFDKVLAVNLRGSFLCAQQAMRAFLDSGSGGAIVNVSSVHQVIPKPRFVGLLRVQGRHAEPHAHAGAGVRRHAASGSTASAPARR